MKTIKERQVLSTIAIWDSDTKLLIIRSYELVCAERFSSVVHDSQLIRISLFKNEKTLKAQSIWAILGNLDQYLVAKMRCSKIDPTGWKLTKLQKKQKNLPKLGFCRLSVM